jgi:hypothetical protein
MRRSWHNHGPDKKSRLLEGCYKHF